LPEHYDVDTPEDFRILKKEIFADRHSQKLAARTYQWVFGEPRGDLIFLFRICARKIILTSDKG
jgi:hypothetical protein